MDLIPEELRRSHEDGEVVFFCGAGVSMPAGLPSFKKLVKSILTDLLPGKEHCQPSSTEALAWRAFEDERYDEALDILESPQQGGYEAEKVRERVRHHLSERRPKTLDKHLTLAQLSDLDTDRGRLVTTNFDSVFEKAQKKLCRQEGAGARLQKRTLLYISSRRRQDGSTCTHPCFLRRSRSALHPSPRTSHRLEDHSAGAIEPCRPTRSFRVGRPHRASSSRADRFECCHKIASDRTSAPTRLPRPQPC